MSGMSDCKYCVNAGDDYCFACDNGNQFKPMTNYDLLISKTPEELAQAIEEFSYKIVSCPKDKCHLEPMSPYDSLDRNECRKCWLSWLKAPVEVDDG